MGVPWSYNEAVFVRCYVLSLIIFYTDLGCFLIILWNTQMKLLIFHKKLYYPGLYMSLVDLKERSLN